MTANFLFSRPRLGVISESLVPPPAPLPVSVVIIARNEAGNLPRCLDGMRGWVSEIVVALNETTDDSRAIAERLGATVIETAWRGYRDTKNWALDRACQPWALALDADEAVSPALRSAIDDFFRRGDQERFAGALFPRKVWFINRWIAHGDWYPDYSLRLFRRDRARWTGDAYLHEKISCDGPVATLSGDLLHHPYPTLGAHHLKILTYAKLFAEKQAAAERPWTVVAAIVRPAWRFFRGYVLRRGFLDGFPGFVAAAATAYYTFLRYACHYEHTRRKSP